MISHGDHGEGGKQRQGETKQEGEVACHPLAGSALDGPVPDGQCEREYQERGELQGKYGRAKKEKEAGGEGPDHQRAARIVIRAVLRERYFESRDEFLSNGATVQFSAYVVEVAWIDQHQVQEMARNKQQQESAERSAGIA